MWFDRFIARAGIVNSPRFVLVNELLIKLRKLRAQGEDLSRFQTLDDLQRFLRAKQVAPQLIGGGAAMLWSRFKQFQKTSNEVGVR
jgi:hypothetical protein